LGMNFFSEFLAHFVGRLLLYISYFRDAYYWDFRIFSISTISVTFLGYFFMYTIYIYIIIIIKSIIKPKNSLQHVSMKNAATTQNGRGKLWKFKKKI
jgi:hypothetical protein